MSEFKLSKTSRSRLKGVKKDLITLIERVLAKSEVDFGIPEYGGFRTAQEQNNLYHRKERVTFIDGFKRISEHQKGEAFDIFVLDEHGACWNCLHHYKNLAKLFKEEFAMMKEEGLFKGFKELGWGGDFVRPKDYPHFQLN